MPSLGRVGGRGQNTPEKALSLPPCVKCPVKASAGPPCSGPPPCAPVAGTSTHKHARLPELLLCGTEQHHAARRGAPAVWDDDDDVAGTGASVSPLNENIYVSGLSHSALWRERGSQGNSIPLSLSLSLPLSLSLSLSATRTQTFTHLMF